MLTQLQTWTVDAAASSKQVFPRGLCAGETISEGGFAANRVSAASLLDVSESTDKKGKKYYKYDLLVRSGKTLTIG